MKRLFSTLALCTSLLVGLAAPSRADTVLDGTTDGGAFFRIVVPTVWNGDLVIWNHGFSLNPVGPVTDLGPLASLQLSQGYAVAASSYQQIGWALFKTKPDLQNMMGVFNANFGTPNQVIVSGGSLGGIVTAQAVEKANLGNVVGAYPICGAVAGSRNWDAGLDLRLVYDAVCANTPAAAIPGGATGLPAPGFPSYPFTNTQLGLAVNACTGILTPPAFRTPQQNANLALFVAETDLPGTPTSILTDMGFATFAISDLIYNPTKLDGKQGIGNFGVSYEDPGIDAAIERVESHPGGRLRLLKNFTPLGAVGDVKIVSIHTDGDYLVIIENEKEYQDVVAPGNLTVAVINEAGNTHCGFSNAETVGGWESLRGWLAGGPQPSAASVQATCLAVAPLVGGACRVDPGFVIPDMDGRVPPR